MPELLTDEDLGFGSHLSDEDVGLVEQGSLYSPEEGARLQAEANQAAGDVPEVVPDTLGNIGSAAWRLANTAVGHSIDPLELARANDVLTEVARMGMKGFPIKGAREELNRRLAEQPERTPSTGEQILAGTQNVINENLATPLALALPVLNKVVPAPLAKAAGIGFAAHAVEQLPEVATEAGRASVTGDPFERTKAYGNLGMTLGIPAAVAMDLIPKRSVKLNTEIERSIQDAIPERIPETADVGKAPGNSEEVGARVPQSETSSNAQETQSGAPRNAESGAESKLALEPKEHTQLVDDMLKMSPEEMQKWGAEVPGGGTTVAYEIGRRAKTQGFIDSLKEREQAIKEKYKDFQPENDEQINQAITDSTKAQLLNEAWGFATGIGSGGEYAIKSGHVPKFKARGASFDDLYNYLRAPGSKVSFENYLGELGDGRTGYGHDLGSKAKTSEDVAKLKDLYESFRDQFSKAKESGDMIEALKLQAKSQAAHEAYQAATGTNVQGEPATSTIEAIKKVNPDYQPPAGPKEAVFGGYQYGKPVFETPGARPGWKSHITEETAKAQGYKVPDKFPTEADWKASQQEQIKTEAIPAYEHGNAVPGSGTLAIDPFFYQSAIKPLGRAAKAAFDSPVAKKIRTQMEDIWNAAALKSAPKLTRSNRQLGEAGVRYASSHMVGRTKGQIFADKVLAGTEIDPVKFGTALAEDNLRSIKESRSPEEAAKVRTLVGDETSPFKTEAEYQQFLNDPATQAAIERHKQLWAEQKDSIYRQANDLDPDLPLETRGLQTGARINLKALQPDEAGVAPIGRPRSIGFRQLATLKRRDPFGRKASGAGQAYEGHYHEIMANGFERELPVAAQHEFLRQLIENGDAKVTDKMREPDLELKGEGVDKGYLLTLKPWTGKFIHVRKGLQGEFESISGLNASSRLPVITAFNDFMTRQSVAGLAEGTTHASNLMTQVFTMPGPTANSMLNALVKSLGRVDLLYSIPRVIIKGFTNQRERMLELAEIGAAKEGYPGAIAKRILNPIDQGVRLVSDDVYKGLAEKGIVENTETARREFINQVGQYNKALQPKLTRYLRETGVNPFITAGQTFNAQGLRRLAMAPGVKGTTLARSLSLKADVAAGWIGGIVLLTALNQMISGKPTGPIGTPLGAVGWVGDDGKVHSFNLMRLLGYERGLRITGIGPAIQAKRLGLSTQQAAKAGGESVTSAGLGMLAGPGPRAAVIASTGLRPTQPWIKEAPVVPPSDSLSPLKGQMAANIQTAIEEANPILSSATEIRRGLKQGKPAGEVVEKAAEKQLSRYTPRAGMSEKTAQALPKIVNSAQLKEYVDSVAKEARKLPLNKRYNFVRRKFNEDELEKKFRDPAWEQIQRKGVLKYR